MKPVLVSGIKPEGHGHLGNYLGSLKNFVDLQNSGKYHCYFFEADLHSLTEEFSPKEKLAQTLELAAEYLAAGLNPEKSVIFLQSGISAHTELTWLLTTITPEPELRRMTQYKDKVLVKKKETNAGLLMYPVLMAADILLYDAAVVPVGEDQLQHLELARTLARKFNARFGKTFVEPKALLTKTPRVMSLKNPTKKMSKSQPDGCLFLDDTPEEIKRKLARAVTDSGSAVTYEPHKKPGLANLIEMYAALSHMEPAMVAREFAGEKYAVLKTRLAELVAAHFEDFRKKKKALLAEPAKLAKILADGSARAAHVAEKKMAEVKERVGLTIR
jgi:tryptophanyl-tRNA synthetase